MNTQNAIELLEQLAKTPLSSVKENRMSVATAAEQILQLPVTTLRHCTNLKTQLDDSHFPQLYPLQVHALNLVNDHQLLSEQKQTLQNIINQAKQTLSLRHWSAEDAQCYYDFLDDDSLWSMVPENKPEPFTLETAAELIETANTFKERHSVFAIIQGGQVIGQARVQFDSLPSQPGFETAEISYWLGKSFRNQGLGSCLIPFITDFFFTTYPSINYLFADVLAHNIPSQRVVEKAGYHYQGIENRKDNHENSQLLLKRYFALQSMYPTSSS